MDFKRSIILATKSGIDCEQFWSAINIYIKNPHAVSKRLCGSISVYDGILRGSGAHSHQELLNKVRSVNVNNQSPIKISELLVSADVDIDSEGGLEALRPEDDVVKQRCTLSIKKLLPRRSNIYGSSLELIILDKERGVTTFANIYPDDNTEKECVFTKFPFSIQLVGDEMQLLVHNPDPEDTSITWLQNQLFPKLVKWALSDFTNTKSVTSLALISLDSYNILYQQLKNKYGKRLVEMWPEVTDPSKYVYEDIAIAAYLLLLWEREREGKGLPPDKKQTFVDVGCGNGLLVFILSSEGHSGIGFDVRKRGIWDYYPETTKLEVRLINPGEDCTFQGYDWLIGNHSDELTPWIPVWASQNSYNCNFFLLPCCSYDFAGNKYQRQNTSLSKYGEYIDYVHQIGAVSGFRIEIDRLKIPSTKRTCLVGCTRTYLPEESDRIHQDINSLINSRCANHLNIQLRPPVEKVRNCTQLKKGIIEEVIKIVVDTLLKETTQESAKWNRGGRKSLGELAEIIPKEVLLELKSECGGLQTLLRNHRYIFEVSCGNVRLREPVSLSTLNAVSKLPSKKRRSRNKMEMPCKRKPCWFHINHPNGCPLSAEECSFTHT